MAPSRSTTRRRPIVGGSGSGVGGGGAFGIAGNSGTLNATQAASTGTFAGNAQGGTSAPIVEGTNAPTIVVNYIIKR